MTSTSWQAVLSPAEILDALEDAADRCVLDGCVHTHRNGSGQPTDDPAWCNCDENRMDPREFVEWLREAIRHSGARELPKIEPAGRPNRSRKSDPRLTLAIAV